MPDSYTPSERTREFIEKAFVLNRPNEEQAARLDRIRYQSGELASAFTYLCPDSAELTLALRALHLASQHAVTAILFNEPKE